jgi:hypothetical protein
VRPYLEKTHHKKTADGVVQGVGPESKLQYRKRNIYFLVIIKSLYYENILIMITKAETRKKKLKDLNDKIPFVI